MAGVTLIVLIINVMSRGLALVSNSLVTACFGATSLTSAYSFSITLANIITTVVGTTLTTSVIPIYTELRELGDKKRTNAFLNNTVSLTVIVSFALIVLGGLLAPMIAGIAGKGDFEFSVFAIRILLFSILFMSMFYIFSGILQANGKFYLAAAVSIPSSIITMVYILTSSDKFGMYGLVVATLIGFFAQAAILVPSLSKTDYRFRLSFKYNNPDMKRIFIVVAPVIVGICAHQINILTNSSIAFRHDAENYIVLNNAQNLGVQIVLTMVLAIASVIYPKLSEMAAKKDDSKFSDCLTSTLNGIILLLIPLSFGFFMLGSKFIDLIYGYGKFTSENVALGGSVFSLYAVGLLGLGFKEITDRAFYARKNTRVSALNGVLIMVLNIAFSIIFVNFFGLRGIALAYSLAAILGGINIIWQYTRKFSDIKVKSLLVTLVKALIGSAVMAVVLYFVKNISFGGSKISVLLSLAVSGLAGVAVYGIALVLLRTEEVKNILNFKEKSK